MRRIVILNPWAGRGTAGQRRDELEQALRAAGVAFDLVTTHARGGATELTYQAIERGYDQVIAVGGDGTLNEVLNGIMGSRESIGKDASLAVVPLGTGSDFIKSFEGQLPNDLAGAARRLARNTPRAVDVGSIRVSGATEELSRCFINGLGMGLDAQVAAETARLTKLKGFAVYLVAIIRVLANYKSHLMTVRFDDYEVRRRLLFATVGNGRFQGGGFILTPEAQIDDGLLDLCMVERLRLDEIIRYLPRLMDGSHISMRQVVMGKARQITLTCPTPIHVATDGEVVATDAHRVEVEVVPGALAVVV
jgi:YegS/Rv2252/BmrU family lipid kinase